MATFKGLEAIGYLTSFTLGERDANGIAALIVEHDAGIDIDNGARGYDHETDTDYAHVMWQTLLYMSSGLPNGYTFDDLFSIDVDMMHWGATDSRVRWFHINEDIFDGESRGTHFQFFYREEVKTFGYRIGEGDLFPVPVGEGQTEYREVIETEWVHGSADTLLVATAEGKWLVGDETIYTVKRWQ